MRAQCSHASVGLAPTMLHLVIAVEAIIFFDRLTPTPLCMKPTFKEGIK